MLNNASTAATVIIVFILLLSIVPAPNVQGSLRVGNHKVIMILIEFPDLHHSINLSGLQVIGSDLREFYFDQSFGKLNLTVDIDPAWHTALHPLRYYHLDARSGFGNYKIQLVEEALSLADPDVDFSKYQFVVVIHAGDINTGLTLAWSPELGSEDCISQLDGGCQNRVTLDKEYDYVFTTFHEFGHLLGLPDLYDFQFKSDYVDCLDLMAGCSTQSGLSAWSLMKLGWLNEDHIVTVNGEEIANITLDPIESGNGTLAVKVPVGNQRYFVVENRQRLKYDSALDLPLAPMALVYFADDSIPAGQGPLRHRATLTAEERVFQDSVYGFFVIATQEKGLASKLEVGLGAKFQAALIGVVKNSITSANVTIQIALSEGRTEGLDKARLLLADALNMFAIGNYNSALQFSQQAQQAATSATRPQVTNSVGASSNTTESSKSQQATPSYTLSVALTVTIALITTIAVIALTRKRRTQSK